MGAETTRSSYVKRPNVPIQKSTLNNSIAHLHEDSTYAEDIFVSIEITTEFLKESDAQYQHHLKLTDLVDLEKGALSSLTQHSKLIYQV
jgi:cell division FtsZ-interacting protein ZapD